MISIWCKVGKDNFTVNVPKKREYYNARFRYIQGLNILWKEMDAVSELKFEVRDLAL